MWNIIGSDKDDGDGDDVVCEDDNEGDGVVEKVMKLIWMLDGVSWWRVKVRIISVIEINI